MQEPSNLGVIDLVSTWYLEGVNDLAVQDSPIL